MADLGIPGAAVGIVQNGELVYAQGFGVANPETGAPVTQARARPRQPSELERIETQIASREETVAELERKLADDWGDVGTLKEYRGARDELKSLLAHWEELFERSQAR